MDITVFGREGCAPCATLLYWMTKKNLPYKYTKEAPADTYVFPTAIINGVTYNGLPSILRALSAIIK